MWNGYSVDLLEERPLFSTNYSLKFFAALRAVTVEILSSYGLPLDQGYKRYADWTNGRPLGIIEHYTAGIGWLGTVRWLNDSGQRNKASCQFIILDRMLPELKQFYEKYDILSDLHVSVLLISDSIIPCWHAGWVNKLCVGFENRNAGRLKGSSDNWRWWANDWKAKFPASELGKTPIKIEGVWWEPYTRDQVAANILLGQHLHCMFAHTGGLKRSWVLPHSAVSGTKSDTGRAFPLQDVRDAIFAQAPISGIPWLKSFEAAPTAYVEALEYMDDELFLRDLQIRQDDRMYGELDTSNLEGVPSSDLQRLVQRGEWRDELDAVRRGLAKLGYHVQGSGRTFDETTATAVYQFQKSVKCEPYDKIPGDKTQRAIYRRLADFKLDH